MNGTGLATLSTRMLADAVDETLIRALAGYSETCVWCGDGPVRVTAVEFWTSEVTVRCPHCGSELSGAVPRNQMEVPA